MIGGQWNAVLQIRSRRVDQCWRFEGLPIVGAVHLSIVEDPAADPSIAPNLFAALDSRMRVLSASGGSTAPHRCDHSRVDQCKAREEPECLSVLIAVTGNRQIDHQTEVCISNWHQSTPSTTLVLPVVPSGASVPAVLAPPLDRIGALRYDGDPNVVADTVMQRSGIGGASRRLFISYRRTDCRDLADQLFDTFTRAGFEVFLDRFSGTAGRLFPDEIGEEIVDKGVVLLLESPGLRHSPWTLAEAAFAFLFRIGLLAVNVDGAAPLSLIAARDRLAVRRSSGGTLGAADLADVLAFVRREYPRQILERRLFLETLLRWGLETQGIAPNPTGGDFEVASGGSSYRVGLSERAPQAADVRRISQAAAPAGAHPVVLGPYVFLSPSRRRDCEWLAGLAGAGLMAEGEVLSKCVKIGAGNIPV